MISIDNKISLFANTQLPDFIVEEYPTFVNFVKAYYEFLENRQVKISTISVSNTGLGYTPSSCSFLTITLGGLSNTPANIAYTTDANGSVNSVSVISQGIYSYKPTINISDSFVSTPNYPATFVVTTERASFSDVHSRGKELIDIMDVDKSLDDFEDQFFNTFLELFPKDTLASKSLLLKNAVPLYLSKGNLNSFRYFFRALFDEEIDFTIPRNDILVASGGIWKILKVLRAKVDVYSLETISSEDGKSIFYLVDVTPGIRSATSISVYVDDVLQVLNVDYIHQKEYKKIKFNNPVAKDSVVKIVYDHFDETLIKNRKVTGIESGATGIIERVVSYKISGFDVLEFLIDDYSIQGQFKNAEPFYVDYLNDDESLTYLYFNSFSILSSIKIVDGGSLYNVGDLIYFIGGSPTVPANAIISSVYTGTYDQIQVQYGGAGFKVGYPINVDFQGQPYSSNGTILAVDTSGQYSANSYNVNTDSIYWKADASATGTGDRIDYADYRAGTFGISAFPGSIIPTPNMASRLIDVFEFLRIGAIGPISKARLLDSNANTTITYTIEAVPPNVSMTPSYYSSVRSPGSIGRVDILSPGSGYKIGDKISFSSFYGTGGRAAIVEVTASGGIKKLEMQPYPPTGNCFNVSVTAGSTSIVGTNSKFITDFSNNDTIMVFNQKRIINADGIVSNTVMKVNLPFEVTKSNTEIGLFDAYPLGGMGYYQEDLKDCVVSVLTSTGTGAILKATSIMGEGEILSLNATHKAGEIKDVLITDTGAGYKSTPIISMKFNGDGLANLIPEIQVSYYEYPGKSIGTGGQLSSNKRLQDSLIFNTGTYILKTKQQFYKFKSSLKKLLHPSGTLMYTNYISDTSIVNVADLNDNEKNYSVIYEFEIDTP